MAAQVAFTMEQGGWDEMLETPAEQRYIDLYFQTSASEVRGIFSEPEGSRMKRTPIPQAKELEERAVDLTSLGD